MNNNYNQGPQTQYPPQGFQPQNTFTGQAVPNQGNQFPPQQNQNYGAQNPYGQGYQQQAQQQGYGYPQGFQQQGQPFGGGYGMPGMSGKGPVGKIRNPVAVILLPLVTCGIYSIIWVNKISKEINAYYGQELTKPSYPFLGLLCFPFWYVAFYKIDEALAKVFARENKPYEQSGTLWVILLLLFVGWFIVPYKIQTYLNELWEGNQAYPGA